MAMQKALDLPELVESIIFHLPEKDVIFNAQRVSRTWKAIVGSPKIQKKTYLLPVK